MDTYMECLVTRKSSPLYRGIAYACFALAAFFFFTSSVTGLIYILVAAAFAGLGYFSYLQIQIEYEYLYAEKEISVDRIRNLNSRKHVADYPLEKVEIFAPINSWHLGEYKNQQLKVIDYSIGYAAQPDARYVMITEAKEKIILSPSPAFVEMVKNSAPRKVFTD